MFIPFTDGAGGRLLMGGFPLFFSGPYFHSSAASNIPVPFLSSADSKTNPNKQKLKFCCHMKRQGKEELRRKENSILIFPHDSKKDKF